MLFRSWDGTSRLVGVGSMKLGFTPSASGLGYELNDSPIGPVDSTKSYILRVSTLGTSPNGILSAALRMTDSPYANLVDNQYRGFGAARVDHEFLIVAPITNAKASIVIAINDRSGTTYLDAIRLYEASATVNDPTKFVRFEYNTSGAPRTVTVTASYKAVEATDTGIVTSDVAAGATISIPAYSSVVLIEK